MSGCDSPILPGANGQGAKLPGGTIPPGATLGVLGGGQLGRMFTQAAHRMGYRVHVFVPEADSPAGQIADHIVNASYSDLEALAEFARGVSVVTFEFENVPAAASEAAAKHAPVRPGGSVLHTTQNRLREKTALRDAGLAVTPFAPVRSEADLDRATADLGTPAILKTAAWGYDGKGQVRIDRPQDAPDAWRSIASQEAIYEKLIRFDREVSVVAARSTHGQAACYQPIENQHANHILDLSICPASLPDSLAQQAIDIAGQVMSLFDVVGVACVEFFVTEAGGLLINEIAPRPHNSGHLTLDACVTSQFEQQVRAICGLPLGSTKLLRPAAAANLLGDLWESGNPRWDHALADPDVKLHLYGKDAARPGRKMGHLTATAPSTEAAIRAVRDARAALLPTRQAAP